MAVPIVSRVVICRAVASAAMAVILMATTLQAAAPASPPADQATAATPLATAAPASPAMGDGPMVSAMTPVSADPGYAGQIEVLGLDAATAAFMARTLSTVEVSDAHTFLVHHAFPNGATGDEAYHLVQGSGMSPGDPPTIVYEILGDELRYQVRYALDPGELPEDLRAQVLEGLPVLAEGTVNTTTATVRLLGLAPLGPIRGVFAADAPSTVEVVVDGVISQGKSTAIGTFVKFGEKQGFTKTANSYKAFKAGKKVWEAVEANDLIASALDRLKALRKCAEVPHEPCDPAAVRREPRCATEGPRRTDRRGERHPCEHRGHVHHDAGEHRVLARQGCTVAGVHHHPGQQLRQDDEPVLDRRIVSGRPSDLSCPASAVCA